MGIRIRKAGEDIGGYFVLSTLGRGGSGDVYRVRDNAGDEFALKLVDVSNDAEARTRLGREVTALQSVRHASVPRVWDAELDGDLAFVVFELVEGLSLSAHVAEHGPLEGAPLADFAEALASALAAVHNADAIHRDVTPSNVMMSPQGPMLIDFGLSHHVDDERVTREGLVSGTPGYVAPEVIDGAEPSAAADLWAWAAVVAFAASGQAPFGTGNGALSKTLSGKMKLGAFEGVDAVREALGTDESARPNPAMVVAALRGQTVVLNPSSAGATRVMATEPSGDAPVAETRVMPVSGERASKERAPQEGEWTSEFLQSGEPGDQWLETEWDDDDDYDYDDDDDEYDDDGDFDGSLPPLARSRASLISLWSFALIAAAAVAPLVAYLLMVTLSAFGRTEHRRVAALAARRERSGKRKRDDVVNTVSTPWHFVRGAVETLPAALLAFVVGSAAGLLSWWFVDAREGWSETTLVLAHGAGLAVAGALAAAFLWWGPWTDLTRDGVRRMAAALTPGPQSLGFARLVAVMVLGAAAVALWLGTDTLWWPLPQMPDAP